MEKINKLRDNAIERNQKISLFFIFLKENNWNQLQEGELMTFCNILDLILKHNIDINFNTFLLNPINLDQEIFTKIILNEYNSLSEQLRFKIQDLNSINDISLKYLEEVILLINPDSINFGKYFNDVSLKSFEKFHFAFNHLWKKLSLEQNE